MGNAMGALAEATGTCMIGVLLLSIGCGGRAASSGEPPTRGTPHQASGQAGTGSDDATAGTGGGERATVPALGSASEAAAPQAPDPEVLDPPCTGSLDELNAMGGVSCPPTWCEGSDLARNCGSLSPSVTHTSQAECDQPDSAFRWSSLDFQLASGEHKICRYQGSTFVPDGPPALREIELTSRVRSYCGGASQRISTSDGPEPCAGIPSLLCDGSKPATASGSQATSCFNVSAFACTACCPAQSPDCSVEAEAAQYPAYGCTMPENPYCVCGCVGGAWLCGC